MNEALKLDVPKSFELLVGSRNDNPAEWTAFSWEDPIHGQQTKGDLIVIRPEGSSGSLMSGLWRTSPVSAGCRADGSCTVVYSAPLGDETMLILEGEAFITVTHSGQKHHIKAGDIISHPKGLDATWEIPSPFLKKMWVIWDSPHPYHSADDFYRGNITGKHDAWLPFDWHDPQRGPQRSGEMQLIRDHGATGTLMCGLWRTGMSSPPRNADGSSQMHYCAPRGDETFMVLEGEAVLTVAATGKETHVQAGDIIGQPRHLDVHWAIKTPFFKKFWVLTDALPPAS